MPAKANSLKVTDSYRRRMVAIRERAKSEARKTWSKVRLSDLDATYNPGMLAVSVAAMQREAAQLSAGYLGAFIASETGSKIPLPTVQSLAGQAPNGANLRAVLDTPLIGVKIDIGEGMTPELALQKGGSRLVRLVGAATDQSAREALRVAMDEADEVEGYQRAVKGTCGACAGMADGSTLPAGTELEIHPDCQCVSEPKVVPRFGKASDLSAPSRTLTGENIEGVELSVEGAVDQYQGNWFSTINDTLRDVDAAVTERVEALTKAIDQGMIEAPTRTESLKLFRGLPRESIDDIFGPDDIVGKILDEPAFSSTTAEREFAAKFGDETLEMTVSPEVKALRLAPEEGYADFNEVLLERQLRYRVSGVRHEGKRRIIEVMVTAP